MTRAAQTSATEITRMFHATRHPARPTTPPRHRAQRRPQARGQHAVRLETCLAGHYVRGRVGPPAVGSKFKFSPYAFDSHLRDTKKAALSENIDPIGLHMRLDFCRSPINQNTTSHREETNVAISPSRFRSIPELGNLSIVAFLFFLIFGLFSVYAA